RFRPSRPFRPNIAEFLFLLGNQSPSQIFDSAGTFIVTAAQQILATFDPEKPDHHTHRGSDSCAPIALLLFFPLPPWPRPSSPLPPLPRRRMTVSGMSRS